MRIRPGFLGNPVIQIKREQLIQVGPVLRRDGTPALWKPNGNTEWMKATKHDLVDVNVYLTSLGPQNG